MILRKWQPLCFPPQQHIISTTPHLSDTDAHHHGHGLSLKALRTAEHHPTIIGVYIPNPLPPSCFGRYPCRPTTHYARSPSERVQLQRKCSSESSSCVEAEVSQSVLHGTWRRARREHLYGLRDAGPVWSYMVSLQSETSCMTPPKTLSSISIHPCGPLHSRPHA